MQLPTYSLEFPPTSGTGAPERTASGGRRDDSCLAKGGMPATALVPQDNVGTTVAQTPTLFFYIPQNRAQTAELTVMDQKGQELFTKTVALTGNGGVVKVDFPTTAKLATNQTYSWEFAIVCDAQDRTQDQFMQGMIRRTELSRSLQGRLRKANLLQQAQIYAEAKVWQESLAIAAQLRPTNPQPWEQLLRSVGLEGIAGIPFL